MRIKRGQAKKQRHKKILKLTKGFRLSYSKLYKRAREAVLHAGKYNFAHRRRRQSQFRRTWISRINAGLSDKEISYSKFINALSKKEVKIDRKILAAVALDYPVTFKNIVDFVK